MAIVSLVMTITYPVEPNQISLIGAFTIGIPGFLLALEIVASISELTGLSPRKPLTFS